MKKHKTILFCLVLVLLGCNQSSNNSSDIASDLKPESTGEPGRELNELLLKVEAQLPDGWVASLAPEMDHLVVALEKKANVEYRSEAASNLLKRADEQIQIALVQVPFLTLDEYQEKKNSNQLAKQKRIAFEEKHLSHLFDQVQRDHKISNHPFPPDMYEPQAAEDKKAVNDYTELWQNTKPSELPSHRFKGASFTLEHYPITDAGSPHVYIVDEQVSTQHDNILVSIKGILSEYE